jgi:hypothetical protein
VPRGPLALSTFALPQRSQDIRPPSSIAQSGSLHLPTLPAQMSIIHPPKLQSALSSCSDGRGTLLLSESGQPSSTLEDLQARKPQECCRPPTSALSSRRRGPEYHGPTKLRKNYRVSSGVSGFFTPDASAFPSCFCGCPSGTFSAATAAVVAWTQVLLNN